VSEIPLDEQATSPSAVPPRLQFRLAHVVYVTALLASALATFGPGGIAPGLAILGAWGYVFGRRSRPRALATVCLLLTVGFCCCPFFLLQSWSRARNAMWRTMCLNNLKQIATALNNYSIVYGSLPPVYIPEDNGKPKHSWRVLILPFVEGKALYKKYDFDEPWNSPNNRKVAQEIPYVYACPSHSLSGRGSGTATSYVAVLGPQTAWPDPSARQIKDVARGDGTSQTILIIEAYRPDVLWTEPSDVSFDEAIRLLSAHDPGPTDGHRSENFFYKYDIGRNVAMVDGSVHLLSASLPRETAAALLTIDGGESVEELAPRTASPVTKRLKLGNCYRLAVFVLLTLLPLRWVWIRRESNQVADRSEIK
jgi:hypothetical protein